MTIEFQPYGKTPRLYRDVVISEKIDGTNACIVVAEGAEPSRPENVHVTGPEDTVYTVKAQSRNRFIYPGDDNYGFAGWVWDNAEELANLLGPGHHYGEWWGKGISHGYGQTERFFSLFNVKRWGTRARQSGIPGLRVVPVVYVGPMTDEAVTNALMRLRMLGSEAAHNETKGKAKAEGIVVFHTASQQPFKVLIEHDNMPKSLVS